jgi:hypothetical protein
MTRRGEAGEGARKGDEGRRGEVGLGEGGVLVLLGVKANRAAAGFFVGEGGGLGAASRAGGIVMNGEETVGASTTAAVVGEEETSKGVGSCLTFAAVSSTLASALLSLLRLLLLPALSSRPADVVHPPSHFPTRSALSFLSLSVSAKASRSFSCSSAVGRVDVGAAVGPEEVELSMGARRASGLAGGDESGARGGFASGEAGFEGAGVIRGDTGGSRAVGGGVTGCWATTGSSSGIEGGANEGCSSEGTFTWSL